MEGNKRQPLGVELVRKGIVTEAEVNQAIEYQKAHRKMKLGEILRSFSKCDPQILIEAIGEILGERGILLNADDIEINMEDYISLDVAKECKAVPFAIAQGKVKVCFADTFNKSHMEKVRLILLNRGLVMERYITFEQNIDSILNMLEGDAVEDIDANDDTVKLVDSIIKTAMSRRASDIHFEPMEDKVRVRFRIDGELYTVTEIPSDKQQQIVGRLKAISNMYQEKQEDQDGRIVTYPDYNIRVSSQRNIYGEKFVLRLLKKNQNIKELYDLGFPKK